MRQSKAVVKLDWNQGVALIGPRSSIRVTRLRQRRGGAVTHFQVNYGAMWMSVRKFNNPYSEIVIQYKNGPRQVIRGTQFGISYNGQEGAIVTKEGSVAVFSDEGATIIGPGEGAVIDKTGKIGEAMPARTVLGHDSLQVEQKGAFWEVYGSVASHHCVKDHCVAEPVKCPTVKFLGAIINSNCSDSFRYKTKPPVYGESTFIQIQEDGQTGIIKLKPSGLLPKHP